LPRPPMGICAACTGAGCWPGTRGCWGWPITEGLRCHSQRLDFMGKALQRYLNAFLAATAELLPERKPFPDEDERSAGKLPARPQARAAKAAKATAGQKKAPKGEGQVFATRGRQGQDAPADGRFSRRDEL